MFKASIAKTIMTLLSVCGKQVQQLREKELEIQNLRAHLMELRVSNESPRGAIGWMVSAFVPDSAVAALQEKPERIADFQKVVAEALVANALRGILKLNKEGKCQALIFEPAQQKVLKSRPWFESDTNGVSLIGAKLLAEEAEERSKRNARALGMYHAD
jgi:hypothetical protein